VRYLTASLGRTSLNLRPFIEHTMLSPAATHDDVARVVDEAIDFQVLGLCIAPCWVKFATARCSDAARGASPKIVAVIGFPHGNGTTDGKVVDAEKAVQYGAEEIDMVMQIGFFKSGDFGAVATDISRVADACKRSGATALKVILETGFLSDDEIILASRLAADSGADFVKTSTGFGPRGASIEDIRLMRKAVDPKVGIKASGGIRTEDAAIKMINAGASRIGTSSTVQILTLTKKAGVA
jgi:deoxyribose-phosphate aldolase